MSAKADDACRVLKQALIARGVSEEDGLTIRTDNGPQFASKKFQAACEKLPVTHVRIPVNTPNLNAFIESFHAILENDCLSRQIFNTYAEAYKAVTEFMDFYNNKRRHGSLGNKPPNWFYENQLTMPSNDFKLIA